MLKYNYIIKDKLKYKININNIKLSIIKQKGISLSINLRLFPIEDFIKCCNI